MDTKWFARAGVGLFLGVVITVAVIDARTAPQSRARAESAASTVETDPLRGELIRCQSIGQDGASDPECLRAWAENRHRFLAPGARPADRLPDTAPAPAAGASNGLGPVDAPVDMGAR